MKNVLERLLKIITNKSFLNFALAAAVLLPAVILMYFVITQSRNTPYMDQWELVTKFRQVDAGNFGFDDLWSQHNEHRLVFPISIMMTMAYFTDWNVRAEMLVSIFLALSMFGILFLITKQIKQITINKWIYALVLMIVSVFVFSLSQAENWLWGWQIQWYLACLGFVAMVWALNRDKITVNYQLVGGVAALVSTYSLGNGQLAWLIGALILYVHGKKLRYWIAAALVAIAAYQINLQRTGLETPITDLILHPLKPVLYFFVYLGRPISDNIYMACIAGFVGLMAFLACISYIYLKQRGSIKDRLKILVTPLSFALFALLSAAITTISRSSLGVGQAMASRYVTVSNFLWLGLLISFVLAASFVKFKRRYYQDMFVSNVLCLFLALTITVSASGTVFFAQHSNLMKTIQYCTNGPNPSDDCLRATYPHPDLVRDRVEYLKQKGWAGYSEARSTD